MAVGMQLVHSLPSSMRMSLPESPAATHRSRGTLKSVRTYSKASSLPPCTAQSQQISGLVPEPLQLSESYRATPAEQMYRIYSFSGQVHQQGR